MPLNFIDFYDLIRDLVREGMSRVDDEQLARAQALALLRYSADKPLRMVRDVAINEDGRTLPPLDAWEQDWSQIVSVEVPPDLFPPRLLESDAWIVTATPLGERIRLRDAREAGALVRVTYTTWHLETTVPVADREAVALWAAAWLAEQLAALFSSDSAPTIAADSATQSNPARQWAERARTWRARYAALVGATGITGAAGDKPAKTPAGTVITLDLPSTHSNGWLYRRRGR